MGQQQSLAKLYTKCLSEGRIPTAWKDSKMMIIFKKDNKKDLKNYTPTSIKKNTHESTNEKAREDSRRKPTTSARWIQKRIINDIPAVKQLKEK